MEIKPNNIYCGDAYKLIKEMEDKYYKQFTAMEKALSKLQSQTNSLASLLGTNTQQ